MKNWNEMQPEAFGADGAATLFDASGLARGADKCGTPDMFAAAEAEAGAPTEAETLRAAIRIMRRYRGGLETALAVLDETAAALEQAEAPAAPAAEAPAPSVKARVLAHIKRLYFVNELQIAEALGLPVLDVLDALLELKRTDADVIERDGVIGYIGHTDRPY